MFDFTNFKEMKRTFEDYFKPIARMIEEKGGYVEWSVVSDPDTLRRDAFDDSSNDWIESYFGAGLNNWDSVNSRAIALSNEQSLKGLDLPDAMEKLVNNVNRMNKKKTVPIQQVLSSNLSAPGRLLRMFEICLKHESGIYNSETTEPTALAHLLDYLYKYSPLSIYHPSVYINNVRAYGEQRTMRLTPHEMEIIADTVVWYQRINGVIANLHKHDPDPLEATQIEALDRNPTSAYSLPTMANAKSKVARDENLRLARMYKENPSKYGNMPSVENLRIQQGGNCLSQVFKELYPDFDAASEWPTMNMVESALEYCWKTRPPMRNYVSEQPCDYNTKWMSLERLPSSEEERQALVDSGQHDDLILQQHKDKSWKFNFLLLTANPWKLVREKVGSDVPIDEWILDEIWNKNRVVFAAAGPVTLNSQSFIHKVMTLRKEACVANQHMHAVAQWMPPENLLEVMTNLWAAVNKQPDASRVVRELTDEERRICMFLTGDDKSSFDNYQSIVLHQLFNACMLAPFFKQEHHNLFKWCSIHSLCPRLLTFEGEYRFSESMPSGHGTTNDQDTFISTVAGVLDICLRARVRPKDLFDLWQKFNFGLLAQGDDFLSHDVDHPDGEAKEANAAKLCLKLAADKSLMSPRGLEFTRRFSTGEWRYNYAEQNLDILCLHAPIAHSLVKFHFAEHPLKNSIAISSIANISRAGNFVFHPHAVDIVLDAIKDDPLKCGTEPNWYVPHWLMEKWREAGSPKPPSDYHVLIDSPQKLYKIAGEEAQKQGDSLDHIIKGWRAGMTDDVKFEDQVIVKILTAASKHDNAALESFRRRVHST